MSMTEKVPVVTLTASAMRTRFGWKCSCKAKVSGLRSAEAAEISAWGHGLVAHFIGGYVLETGGVFAA